MADLSNIKRCVMSTNPRNTPLSEGVIANGPLYFISGQLGFDKSTGQLVQGGVQAETRQLLLNMGEVLKAVGATYKNVVKCTVILRDANDFQAMNDVYRQFFTDNFPARMTFQAGKVPGDAAVEIEAVAVLDKQQAAL